MKFPVSNFICFRPIPKGSAEFDDHTIPGVVECAVGRFPVLSYNELKAATQGFKNKIGEGATSSVYKGRLRDGSLVAVKVLSVELESLKGEQEFISEMAALSYISHENLVTLRGCCVEGSKRLLVYDYMENNSLAHTFFGEEQKRMKFSWSMRRQISLGVARGLAYLHEEIKPHIVHRDIKAGNILLDHNLTPKVADFGLARLLRDSNISHISTRVAGTLGYLSPEYAISGQLTRKSDVYSFGVLLLEIVTGRPVVDFNLELGEHFLVDKVWEMYKGDKLVQMVDPMLNADFPEAETVRFLMVGLLCVQEITNLRPKMSSAIKLMTNELDIKGIVLSRPGIVADLMDVKIVGNKKKSKIFSSGESSNMSSGSPWH